MGGINIWRYQEYFDCIQSFQAQNNDEKIYINIGEVAVFMDIAGDYIFDEKGKREIAVVTHSQAKTRFSLPWELQVMESCSHLCLSSYISTLERMNEPFQKSTKSSKT